jgi:membrane protein DedA with SNARE-associated domain
MYYVGHWFGEHILETGKIKFIPPVAVRRVEGWFQKWGLWLIVVNRFISGTRGVISFFAGMSGLPLSLTVPLCFISALAWNSILLYSGFVLGHNWHYIGRYLALYSKIITISICVAIAVGVAYHFFRKKKSEP